MVKSVTARLAGQHLHLRVMILHALFDIAQSRNELTMAAAAPSLKWGQVCSVTVSVFEKKLRREGFI
jgi:hypothetical protein